MIKWFQLTRKLEQLQIDIHLKIHKGQIDNYLKRTGNIGDLNTPPSVEKAESSSFYLTYLYDKAGPTTYQAM